MNSDYRMQMIRRYDKTVSLNSMALGQKVPLSVDFPFSFSKIVSTRGKNEMNRMSPGKRSWTFALSSGWSEYLFQIHHLEHFELFHKK
ncbi:MAG: hypothetical protein AB7F86_14290 [Bdellovibrionales bacterium]